MVPEDQEAAWLEDRPGSRDASVGDDHLAHGETPRTLCGRRPTTAGTEGSSGIRDEWRWRRSTVDERGSMVPLPCSAVMRGETACPVSITGWCSRVSPCPEFWSCWGSLRRASRVTNSAGPVRSTARSRHGAGRSRCMWPETCVTASSVVLPGTRSNSGPC